MSVFDNPLTANGMSGGRSFGNTNSRLSKLVWYLKLMKKQKQTATKMGFAKTMGYKDTKPFSDLFQLAEQSDVLVICSTRHNGSTIIELGANAKKVKVAPLP